MTMLGGCGEKAADSLPSADADKIACRPAGTADFEPVCTIERMTGEQGLILIVRHPDGRFRRLLVTRDGRGVIAADGAETAAVTPMGTREIEVTLGGDAYRIPATVRAPK
jgi:hypothetical protein